MLRIHFVSLIMLFAHSLNSQVWKTYPYHQDSSVLNFPRDEGYHPGEVVEWWYVNAHIKGDSTGTDYAGMFTFFYYPAFGFDGFRIFELSNENTGDFLTETQPCKYTTLSQTELEIQSNSGVLGNIQEEWVTIKDPEGGLKPFQYRIKASMANGSIDFNMNAVKRPLMVGGTGFLYEGETGYTYYYSITELQISGTVNMNGVTETIHGQAWIDRQWGEFNPNTGEQYTWMSLNMSNGMDFNLWNIFNKQNEIPNTPEFRFCSAYLNDSTDTTFSDFNLERLKYVYTSDSVRCYDQQWRFTAPNINLLITATQSNNEVKLPFRFFEGSLHIEGVINGEEVSGIGYTELLHSFDKPDVSILAPANFSHQGPEVVPIVWKLNNPDDGRPLWYDLSISTDGKNTFTPIATHLTDTSFVWAPDSLLDAECWLMIKSFSIDTVLFQTLIADQPFYLGEAGIDESPAMSAVKSFPNPFTSGTSLEFELKKPALVNLRITNVCGKEISRMQAFYHSAGRQTINWNAVVPSGIYFYHLQFNGQNFSGKLLKH